MAILVNQATTNNDSLLTQRVLLDETVKESNKVIENLKKLSINFENSFVHKINNATEESSSKIKNTTTESIDLITKSIEHLTATQKNINSSVNYNNTIVNNLKKITGITIGIYIAILATIILSIIVVKKQINALENSSILLTNIESLQQKTEQTINDAFICIRDKNVIEQKVEDYSAFMLYLFNNDAKKLNHTYKDWRATYVK